MAESNRKELLKKVQEADFAAYDLLLFLDTHPNCMSALTKYKEAVEDGAKYRREYEAAYGPLTPSASSAATPWQWIQNPWPWNM